MLFLIAFGLHVAASFAFLLAILSPNWLAVQTTPALGSVTIQRGIFHVCDLITKNTTHQTTRCASILNLDSSMVAYSRWNYSS